MNPLIHSNPDEK